MGQQQQQQSNMLLASSAPHNLGNVHHSIRMNTAFLQRSPGRSLLTLHMAETETEDKKGKRGRPKDAFEDDEAEWRTILAAFQMYKAAYGDLKVPSRFVVPGMAPWPGEFV